MTANVLQLKDDRITQIERYIAKPPSHSVVFTITPKMAAYLIETYNSGNRKIKSGAIARYAEDMIDGKFYLSGDTIKFSDKGILCDGQNRLLASIKAKKSFATHIVFGIDHRVFSYLDRGKNRSSADALFIDGKMKYPEIAAGALAWLERLRLADKSKDGSPPTRRVFEPWEVVELTTEHDLKLMTLAMDKSRALWQVDKNAPRAPTSALYYLFHGKSPALADEFFTTWETNSGARSTCITKAKKKLETLRTQGNGRVHDHVRIAIWILTWNLFVSKRAGTLKDFEWKPRDPWPRIKG